MPNTNCGRKSERIRQTSSIAIFSLSHCVFVCEEVEEEFHGRKERANGSFSTDARTGVKARGERAPWLLPLQSRLPSPRPPLLVAPSSAMPGLRINSSLLPTSPSLPGFFRFFGFSTSSDVKDDEDHQSLHHHRHHNHHHFRLVLVLVLLHLLCFTLSFLPFLHASIDALIIRRIYSSNHPSINPDIPCFYLGCIFLPFVFCVYHKGFNVN